MHIPTKQRHCLSGRRFSQRLARRLRGCPGHCCSVEAVPGICRTRETVDLELTCLQVRALLPIKWGGSFYFTGCGGSGWDGPSVGPSSLPVLGVELSLGFIPAEILGEFSWFIFLLFPCFLPGPRLHLFPRMTFSPCLRPLQSGLVVSPALSTCQDASGRLPVLSHVPFLCCAVLSFSPSAFHHWPVTW